MTHPHDELLSALIDGEAAPSDVDHTESCATCQTRLSELRAAAQLVGRPVDDPPAGARDRAVSAALAAAAAPSSVAGPWWRRPGVLAAAAVVALLAIAAPVVVSAVGDDDDTDVALVSPAGGPVMAGDLGDLAGGEALEDEVRDALSERSTERRAGTPEAAGDDGSAAAEAESGTAALSAAVVDPMEAATRCEPRLRADSDDLTDLVYLATGTWDGTTAVVMAFGRSGRDDGISLYVLDAATCAILNWQRF